MKEQIGEKLNGLEGKIIIFIDDIDRLSQPEIKQFFKLIKAIADFPNIIYILAFDREVVANALKGIQGPSTGKLYLEKIVQLPFEIPIPESQSLRDMFYEKLDTSFFEAQEFLDPQRWNNVFLDGVDKFVQTPRDVIRLANALNSKAPFLGGEVNLVDLMAMESLKVFHQEVFSKIRRNEEYFVGPFDPRRGEQQKEDLEEFHEEWIDNTSLSNDEKLAIKKLLVRVFPKLASIWGKHVYWGNKTYGQGHVSSWRKKGRLCVKDNFEPYKTTNLEVKGVTHKEMRSLISSVESSEDFKDELLELASQDSRKVKSALERLEDYTDQDISKEDTENVVVALLDVGDKLLLPSYKSHATFSDNNMMRIGRVIYQLLGRLDREKRFEILKKGMREGEALANIVERLVVTEQEYGRFGAEEEKPEDGEFTVSEEGLEELEQITLDRIEEFKERGELLSKNRLPMILNVWSNLLEDDEKIKNWVKNTIEDDENLLKYLTSFLSPIRRHGPSDRTPSVKYQLLSPDSYIDVKKTKSRLKEIKEREDLTEPQKQAIEIFLEEH